MTDRAAASKRSIWVVTMAYPVPSEAFASAEINELRRRGVDVSVHTLRGQRRDHDEISAQQSLGDTLVGHAWSGSVWRGLESAIRHPKLALRLWWRLVKTLITRPTVLAACLFWSLRCFELLAVAQRERPDVIHLFWGHAPSMLGWLVIEALPDVQVTTCLGAYDLELALPIGFEVGRRCAGVRTFADPNVTTLIGEGIAAEKIYLIYHGIPLPDRRSDDAPVGGKDHKRIVFAGRLIPGKGAELAIQVLARVVQYHHATRLSILGDGPLRDSLRRCVDRLGVSDAVTFHGHVSRTDLYRELQTAGLFLLPSTLPERLPNVIKEAAAARCCCLTTSTPGIKTLIRDGESGRLLEASNPEAWVEVVTELIEDPETAARMADRACDIVRRQFDIRRTTESLLRMWESRLDASEPANGVRERS